MEVTLTPPGPDKGRIFTFFQRTEGADIDCVVKAGFLGPRAQAYRILSFNYRYYATGGGVAREMRVYHSIALDKTSPGTTNVTELLCDDTIIGTFGYIKADAQDYINNMTPESQNGYIGLGSGWIIAGYDSISFLIRNEAGGDYSHLFMQLEYLNEWDQTPGPRIPDQTRARKTRVLKFPFPSRSR